MKKVMQKPSSQDWELASATIINFKKEGDSVEGIIDGFQDIETSIGKAQAMFILTGEGRQSLIMSHIIRDAVVKNDLVNGDKIKIVFKGVKKLDSGKSLKDFLVFFKKDQKLR